MSSSNLIFVDGEIGTQVEELAGYLGKQTSNTELVDQLKGAGALEVVKATKIATAQIPESDIEAVYNQVFAIVLTLTADDEAAAEACVKEIVSALEANVESGVAALQALNNLYNILPNSQVRGIVIESVINVAAKTGLLSTVAPIISRLPVMLNEWKSTEEYKAALLLQLRDVFVKASFSNEVYETELVFLQTVSAKSPKAKEVATSAIVHFINQTAECDLDTLSSLPTVQSLNKSSTLGDAGVLLDALVSCDYKAWKQFAADKADVLSALDIDAEKASEKIRLLTIASVAAESTGKDIGFDTISQAIEVTDDEVEVWIIDAIRAGLIQGKMNQVTRTVHPTRSTYRVFGTEQWKVLADRLDAWKASLDKLQPVISNAKLIAQQQAMQMAGQARVTIKE